MKKNLLALVVSLAATTAMANGGLGLDNAPASSYQGARVVIEPAHLSQGSIQGFTVRTNGQECACAVDVKQLSHNGKV